MTAKRSRKKQNRYEALIEKIFFDGYKRGAKRIPFKREALEAAASEIPIALPKNLGDVLYSLRYRAPMPARILETQPRGQEWIIQGAGRSQYEFRLVRINRIAPNTHLVTTEIPDATPQIVASHNLSDEQALLAKVRYNRLLDIFLGIATYSLQNHLRTTVPDIGQIEIDEIYVGIDKAGRQYILPVQAKGGKDQLSTVQSLQDITYCRKKFPQLVCRAISAQFMADDLIAMFELTVEREDVRVVDERHYRLVRSEGDDTNDRKAPRVRHAKTLRKG